MQPVPATTTKVLFEGKWICFQETQYKDPKGNTHCWEFVERIPSRHENVDAVDIVATLIDAGDERFLIAVKQYRPPVNRFVLEFPSGLVDKGESCEEAALRELLEETGFRGTIKSMGPVIPYEPGLTNSCSRMAFVEVREEMATPKREDSEWTMETVLLPLDAAKINPILESYQKQGVLIDSRLYAFFVGLHTHAK